MFPVRPGTRECFQGYFYLENILLQGAGAGGRQGVLGPRPLGAAEDRGPWALPTGVAITGSAPFLGFFGSWQQLEPGGSWGFHGAPSSAPTCCVTCGRCLSHSGLPSCSQHSLRPCSSWTQLGTKYLPVWGVLSSRGDK